MSTSALPDSSAATIALPSAEGLFDHWLQARSNDPWTPLTAQAAKPYRFIWGAWSKFLQAHLDAQGQNVAALAWNEASAVQVLHFINHIPQTAKGRKVSDITRRRYWRVLDRIYDHALMMGWVEINPVHAVAASERPPSEDPKGAILSDAMWQAGIAHIPAGNDLVGARDRAVLMLLFELGLAPEELRMLRTDNLLYSTPQEDSGETQIIGVHVEGLRDNQQRKLSISTALARGLAHWLRARAQYPAMQGEASLFCSRKSRTLSNHTLLHLVTKTLSEAAQSSGLPTPARLGPQIVRNTAIVRWLNAGMPLADVVERAGLKNVNGLLHLRDLVSDEARAALSQRARSF
jgi:site-specific recombinase XerC